MNAPSLNIYSMNGDALHRPEYPLPHRPLAGAPLDTAAPPAVHLGYQQHTAFSAMHAQPSVVLPSKGAWSPPAARSTGTTLSGGRRLTSLPNAVPVAQAAATNKKKRSKEEMGNPLMTSYNPAPRDSQNPLQRGYFARFNWQHYHARDQQDIKNLPVKSELVPSIPAMFHCLLVVLQAAEKEFANIDILPLLDRKIVKPCAGSPAGGRERREVDRRLLLTSPQGEEYIVNACRKEHIKLIYEGGPHGGGLIGQLSLCPKLVDVFAVQPGKRVHVGQELTLACTCNQAHRENHSEEGVETQRTTSPSDEGAKQEAVEQDGEGDERNEPMSRDEEEELEAAGEILRQASMGSDDSRSPKKEGSGSAPALIGSASAYPSRSPVSSLFLPRSAPPSTSLLHMSSPLRRSPASVNTPTFVPLSPPLPPVASPRLAAFGTSLMSSPRSQAVMRLLGPQEAARSLNDSNDSSDAEDLMAGAVQKWDDASGRILKKSRVSPAASPSLATSMLFGSVRVPSSPASKSLSLFSRSPALATHSISGLSILRGAAAELDDLTRFRLDSGLHKSRESDDVKHQLQTLQLRLAETEERAALWEQKYQQEKEHNARIWAKITSVQSALEQLAMKSASDQLPSFCLQSLSALPLSMPTTSPDGGSPDARDSPALESARASTPCSTSRPCSPVTGTDPSTSLPAVSPSSAAFAAPSKDQGFSAQPLGTATLASIVAC